MITKWIIFLFCLQNVFSERHDTLKGHQVWEVIQTKSPEQQETFNYLNHDGLIDIMGIREDSITFRIMAEHIGKVKRIFNWENIIYNVIHKDISKKLKELDRKASLRRSDEICIESDCSKPLMKTYMTPSQISWYLKTINSKYTYVNLEILGESHENRDMVMIHIKGGKNRANRKKIWIEGGVHAREWISVATTLHITHRILSNAKLRDNFEFFIIPVTNPDGYAVTHSETGDRMWRKNRRPSTTRDGCIGVDLNRNWGYKWGLDIGSSDLSCGQTYRGPNAFSEPEIKSLRNRMLKIKGLSMTLFFHSYGQLFLYPWGHRDEKAPDANEMQAMGEAFKNAVGNVNGSVFTVGQTPKVLYYVSGGPGDWAKGFLKVKYTNTIELRDDGTYGFELPEDEIVPTIKETWAGFVAMMKKLKKE